MIIRIKTHHKTLKIDIVRFLRFISVLILLSVVLAITVDFLRFPDCYLNTWKYQLKNEIDAGNKQSIEYYQKNYVDKGRILFD